MKLSIYKNPRNDHTYSVERKGKKYLIIERDWMGDEFQVMAFYDSQDKAQSSLDKLADNMEWKFCGEAEQDG